jgi:Co/Zn/Cd efflux system component
VDIRPSEELSRRIRGELEKTGDRVTDLHVWRVGPGHLCAVISVATDQPRSPDVYKSRLAHIVRLSHVTVEIQPLPPQA